MSTNIIRTMQAEIDAVGYQVRIRTAQLRELIATEHTVTVTKKAPSLLHAIETDMVRLVSRTTAMHKLAIINDTDVVKS